MSWKSQYFRYQKLAQMHFAFEECQPFERFRETISLKNFRLLTVTAILALALINTTSSWAQDADFDGILDVDEFVGDTDGDGLNDIFDQDDDNDGILTRNETSFGGGDFDGDAIPNHRDTDDDNDGILTRNEGDNTVDTDGDRSIDAFDVDDDNDGFETRAEGSSTTLDLDNDGRPDYLDDNAPGVARLPQAFIETTTGAAAISRFSPNIVGATSDTATDQKFGDITALSDLNAATLASPTFTGSIVEFSPDTAGLSTVQFPTGEEFILSHRFDLSGSSVPFGQISSKTVFADSIFNMAFELATGTTFDIDISLLANFSDPDTVLNFILDDIVLFSLSALLDTEVQASLDDEFLTAGIHVLSVTYESLLQVPDIQEQFQFIATADVSFLRSNTGSVTEPGTLAILSLGLVGIGIVRRRRSIGAPSSAVH